MPESHPISHDEFGGLARDVLELLARRRVLRQGLGWMSGALLASCGGGGASTASTASTSSTSSSTSSGTSTNAGTTTGTTTTSAATSASSCSAIPEETEGPYPGDGSNTVDGSIANALTLAGIVHSDLRTSVAPGIATATGVPLTLTLKLVSTSNACAGLAGYAIYVWHCDALGRYSLYSSGVTAENYLRGVQVTGGDGSVTFTTIFPGCYAGRVPHIHFEVYANTAAATSFANKLHTSQIALPLDTCDTVYGSGGYGNSAANLATESFATDLVFSDGVSLELATLTGSVSAGYAASLTIGI